MSHTGKCLSRHFKVANADDYLWGDRIHWCFLNKHVSLTQPVEGLWVLPLRKGGGKKKLLSETKSSQHVLKSVVLYFWIEVNYVYTPDLLKSTPTSNPTEKEPKKCSRPIHHQFKPPNASKALAAHALLTSRPRSSRSTRAVPRAVPRIVRRAVELAPTVTWAASSRAVSQKLKGLQTGVHSSAHFGGWSNLMQM